MQLNLYNNRNAHLFFMSSGNKVQIVHDSFFFPQKMKQRTVKGGTELHIYESNKNNTITNNFQEFTGIAITKIGVLFF